MECQISSAGKTSWLWPYLVKDFINSRKWIFLPQSSKSPASISEDVFPLKSHLRPKKVGLASLVHAVTITEKNPASG